jgi:hypothetical protein
MKPINGVKLATFSLHHHAGGARFFRGFPGEPGRPPSTNLPGTEEIAATSVNGLFYRLRVC